MRYPSPVTTFAGSATGFPVGRKCSRTSTSRSSSARFRIMTGTDGPPWSPGPGHAGVWSDRASDYRAMGRPPIEVLDPTGTELCYRPAHAATRAARSGIRRCVAVASWMYRDAYALMLNTVVANSALGLLYWIVAARTSSPRTSAAATR